MCFSHVPNAAAWLLMFRRVRRCMFRLTANHRSNRPKAALGPFQSRAGPLSGSTTFPTKGIFTTWPRTGDRAPSDGEDYIFLPEGSWILNQSKLASCEGPNPN